jgi:hypothetical protein
MTAKSEIHGVEIEADLLAWRDLRYTRTSTLFAKRLMLGGGMSGLSGSNTASSF